MPQRILIAALFFIGTLLPAQDLRTLLLNELQTTHNKQDWFVPINGAVEGLTAEQASWTDGKGNHSVGQLANHLLFWDRRALQKLTGQKQSAFDGNNDETFNAFTAASWAATVRELDEVLTGLEKVVQNADENKLKAIADEISHIATHNAYHTGQMILVRKEQGAWNPDKGVK